MSARIFNFKFKPSCEDRLAITRGQKDMILDYLEGCMLRADDEGTAERFSHVHSMVYAFCQEAR